MDSNEDPTPPLDEKPTTIDNQAGQDTHVDVFRSAVVSGGDKHPKRRLFIILIVLIILAGIGYGINWYFSGSKKPLVYKPTGQTVAHNSVATENKTSSKPATRSYTASDFNLSFNYPEGWTVFNGGSGPMTVTSPSMQLTAADGQKVTGLVIMTIQPQGQLPAAFSAGTALAVLNSQIMTYTQPTTSQPSQAYLSFVQYYSTNTKGGLDGIYLTGNYGYQKDQVIPSSDISSIDPLVTVTFTKCGNAKCTSNLDPLTIASTSWNDKNFQTPIKSMLASLAFD